MFCFVFFYLLKNELNKKYFDKTTKVVFSTVILRATNTKASLLDTHVLVFVEKLFLCSSQFVTSRQQEVNYRNRWMDVTVLYQPAMVDASN